MRTPLRSLVVVFGLLLLASVNPTAGPLALDDIAAAAPGRPNVVVVMMDDMTLQQLPYLPNVNALLKQQGTTFANYYVNTPECCPSRATLLTGQYLHNHGVNSGLPPNGGYYKLDHTNALPVWLSDAGYYTAHIGKYMNGIGTVNPLDRPPGWSDYYGLYEPSGYNYFNYDINHNGVAEHHGTADADYQTDVLGQHAVDVINSRAGATDPFFLYFAPLAPHAGTKAGTGMKYPVPAPRHFGTKRDLRQPRTPDYNELDVSDKPAYVRNAPLMTAQQELNTERYWQLAVESMQSADDWVGQIVNALTTTGQLADTTIIFTSDNGFFHGEHRLGSTKLWPYEVDIHVPLIIRGPGFGAGATVAQHTISPDVTATITDITGASPFVRRAMDGWSLVPMATDPQYGSRRDLLYETGKAMGRVTYAGVRGPTWKYIEYSNGERELYNMVTDPYELTNRVTDPSLSWVRGVLAYRLAVLKRCAGVTCTGTP